MNITVLFMCLAHFFFTLLFSTTCNALVTGTVTYINGEPAVDALITFTDELSSEIEVSAYTDNNGQYRVDWSTGVNEKADTQTHPKGFTLKQNYPNPFNPTTTIPFLLDEAAYIDLSIYNMLGQKIRTLISNYVSAGSYTVKWNGLDEQGKSVSAGLFIYKLICSGNSESKKMLMLDGGDPYISSMPISMQSQGDILAKQAKTTWNRTFRITISGDDIVTFEQSGIEVTDGQILDFVVNRLAFIYIISGNDQHGRQRDILPTPLTILVTDTDGRAIPNQKVDFTIMKGEGTLSVENTTTDINGQASTILKLGEQLGLLEVEAKLSGTDDFVNFTTVVSINEPYSIEIINGDGQVACPGEVLPEPLQVVIKDDRGRPFEGAVVTFNIEEGTGSLSALSDTTSISGIAQTIFSFGDSIGAKSIIASLQGTDSPASVKFTANAVPPTIEIISGNDQYGDPGDILPKPLQVKVVNSNNEPIDSIIVNFKIVLGNGSLFALSDTTNSHGIAQTTLTLGDSVGITEISAELQGMESIDIVTFTATTLPPTIEIVGGNNQMCREGKMFPNPLQVQIKSGKGVPLKNVIVTFSIDESIGELSVLNSTTNSNGIAETQLTAGNVPGYFKITASIQSIDSPVYFIEIVLSPSRIAFTSDRDGNWEIYVMNTNGSVQINLTNNSVYDGYPSWSPDGSQIAFRSYRDGNGEIYVMDADGSNQTNLTNNPNDDFRPLWSPDGSQIAFRSDINGNSEIYVMNSDGSNQTNLTNNSTGDYSPSWSPDGSKIAWVYGHDVHSEIYVMNADGSNLKKMTNNSYWDSHPSWSPDGSQIVFDSRRYGDNIEIYVIYADGSNQTNLTNTSGYDSHPSWSPDGSQIAFYSNRDGDGGIYVMNSDGSYQTKLTTIINFETSWSPDGYQIAFESWRDGNSEIYVMDEDGSNQTNLTNNSAADSSPSWSPLQR